MPIRLARAVVLCALPLLLTGCTGINPDAILDMPAPGQDLPGSADLSSIRGQDLRGAGDKDLSMVVADLRQGQSVDMRMQPADLSSGPPDLSSGPPDLSSPPPDMTSPPATVLVGPNGKPVFSPALLTIKLGHTVRWIWESSMHNVVSGVRPKADGKFCSPDNLDCASAPLENAGFTYDHTFTTAGTYPYFSAKPAGMIGIIQVQP